jgi:glutamate racemase
MISSSPVGIFDSGVGGLSVLREIRRELPAEDLEYVADSAHAPYGDRDAEFIIARSIAMGDFLAQRGVKAVVVACNTATGIAVDALRKRFEFPIVAIEPAVKPAAAQTRSGVVGVLATTQTLASPRFSKLVEAHASGVRVVVQPGTGLVEQIEAGQFDSESTRLLVRRHVEPLLARGADTIVLGCTHYPFLGPLIGEIAGPGVTIIDPAVAVARELRRRLQSADRLAPGDRGGRERFWTTGPPAQVQQVMRQLWGAPVDVTRVPDRSGVP